MASENKLINNERMREILEYAWLELGDTTQIPTTNPLIPTTEEDANNFDKFILKLLICPEYFSLLCRLVFNTELLPLQAMVQDTLWNHRFCLYLATRGGAKTFMIALYIMRKLLLDQGVRIVMTGAGLRQSKGIFEYCENIWYNSPILRDIVGTFGKNGRKNGPRRDIDRLEMIIGDSIAVAIPLGDGSTVRGLRAHIVVADEFQSISREVFEVVVAPFGAVSRAPIDNVKKASMIKVLKELGIEFDDSQEYSANQTILSGTADYTFNHIYDYYKKYKAIIENKGDKVKLERMNINIPPALNYRDFAVLRLPVELMPPKFMDEVHIAQSQSTMLKTSYDMEYSCIFPEDSFGFFKRSLIEQCTTKEPINIGDIQVKFSSTVVGNPKCKYVFGIDPASGGQVSPDNFSITISECYANHRRVVYCWTYTRQIHKEKIKKGYVQDKDFYKACVRKIRELMKVFPCIGIAMDTQGGGFAILEALQDVTGFGDDAVPILEIVEDGVEKDSDMLHGLHIVHMVNFANNNWVVEANNNLRMDMESKVLLFPYIDSLSLAYAVEEDEAMERNNDSLEDCVFNIEELKDELTTIVHTRTSNGTDRWDVPEIKLPGNKKGKMRKDRYSSLLLCNQIARNLNKILPTPEYQTGRLLQMVTKKTESIKPSTMYSGPAWFEEAMRNYTDYGVVVKRS